jgi:N-acetyl-anhydromuramyl-L-alanine amidase AmpD
MKIHPCLLDSNNTVQADGVSIGSMIAATGIEHLWEERRGTTIDTIVIHYISAIRIAPGAPFEMDQILKIFCNFGVSSHYLISRRGAVFLLVPEEKRAWHCGGSIMPEPDNRQAVNEFSIGIELVATPVSEFSQLQYRALSRLCADIERRHDRRFSYTGHENIAGERAVALGLRTEVKVDPGKHFSWNSFFEFLKKARES